MSRIPKFKFRLYISGNTENSAQALSNLTALCEKHLANRHEIELIDVFRDPGRALADRVFMTPTLVRLSPEPIQLIVGTLAQTTSVLQALGLATVAV
jgi:circadian clock protein KaiB